MDGYNIYRNDSKTTKGGGCIIYVRSDFISAKAYPHGWDLLEDAVFVNVSDCNHYSMIVGCVYRPPNSELIIDEHIKEIFLNLSSQNTHILVGGDFNMPEVSWNTFSGPSRFHALLKTLDTNGWKQIVDGQTRKNSQLDLIFLNNLPQYTANISGEFPESDHKVVTCQLIVPCRCVSTIPISITEVRRNLTDADWAYSKYLLRCLEWDKFFSSEETNHSLTIFYLNAQFVLDSIAPPKKRKQFVPSRDYIPILFRKKIKKVEQKVF